MEYPDHNSPNIASLDRNNARTLPAKAKEKATAKKKASR
jgi:hypothetical protein